MFRRRRFLLASAALLAGCAAPPKAPSDDEDKGDTLWPPPPELPRFAYETTLRSPADILVESDEDRLKRKLTGGRLPTDVAFEKPTAVAARAGRIYVTDTVRRFVVVFDVPRHKVFQFGLRPPGTLQKPISIAVDRRQNVYVADATLRQVFVYDSLGLFLRTIGEPKDLERPTGVAVSASGDRVYVIDRSNNESDRHRVLAYDGKGGKLRELGTRGPRDGEFNVPVQGAVADDGTLYVLDAGNFRVQAFDPDGRFLRAFGSVGSSLGQFARPRGIAVDPEGNLYVSDGLFGNVQVFDSAGRLLIAFGKVGRRDRPGRYGLPIGVAVDETGRVYVVDQYYNKVEVIRRLTAQEGESLRAQASRA
jgi:DNA-binding beta-propeller fold protein YncE